MRDETAAPGTQVNFLTFHIVGSYFCDVLVYCKNGVRSIVLLALYRGILASVRDETAAPGTQVNFLTFHIVGSYFCNVLVYCKNGVRSILLLALYRGILASTCMIVHGVH